MEKDFEGLKNAVYAVENGLEELLLSNAVHAYAYCTAVIKFANAFVSEAGAVSFDEDDCEAQEAFHTAYFEYACAITAYYSGDVYACDDDYAGDYGTVHAFCEEAMIAYDSVKDVYNAAYEIFVNEDVDDLYISDKEMTQKVNTFCSYDEAKAFLKPLNLKTKDDYHKWWDEFKPSNLPRDPNIYYKTSF